jgi:hypothetical protein
MLAEEIHRQPLALEHTSHSRKLGAKGPRYSDGG